jgi:PAS domain S-box-containing protein
MLGRLAVAVVGIFATLVARPLDAVSLPQYCALLFACLVNLVYLLFARAGARPGALALVQLAVDVGIVGFLVYLTGIDRIWALLYFGIVFAAAITLSLRLSILLASVATVVLAAVSTLYYLAQPDFGLSLPLVDPEVLDLHRSRLPFLLPFLAVFGLLLHVVALLAGKLAQEIRRVRILNDEILQTMAGGVVAADRFGEIQFINAQASRLLGLEDTHGSRIRRTTQLLPKRVVDLFERALRSGERVSDEFTVSGAPVRVAVSCLSDAGGAARGVVAILSDLSLRTQMEEMTRRAERFEALLQMSAGMAHEIRNPLASIRGAAQELATSKLPKEEDRQLLGVVIRESDRLDEIISEFLDYASDRPLEMGLFDLSELLRETVLLLEARKDRNVEIKAEGPRHFPCRGSADKLKQVFLNLGLNALDACAANVRLGHVAFRWRPGRGAGELAKEGVIIEVTDDGCGIAREDLARVFDPFFTTKPRGVGMGLAIARKIVEGHGGQIGAESEPGKGSTFRVWLPS